MQRTYVYGVQRISQTQVTRGTTSYYGYDGHGDVRFLMDVTGKVTDTYDYDAFGNVVGCTGTTSNVYRYQGEALDAETGLYYLRARYYDPMTGRFLSVDPMADQGEHPYTYAGADPVNGHDATGQQEVLDYSMELAYFVPSPQVFIGMAANIKCLAGITLSTLAQASPLLQSVAACQVRSGGRGGSGAGGGGAGGNGGSSNAKIGIGIEVPAAKAVQNNALNLAEDTGHTIVYFKDVSGKIDSLLSFGPGKRIDSNAVAAQFMLGLLPGDPHWPIQGTLSTWESNITADQLHNGEQAITNFKAHRPNYTMAFNCTSASLSIAAGIGLSYPNGVGPVVFGKLRRTVANPYALNMQIIARFGAPGQASAGSFPNP